MIGVLKSWRLFFDDLTLDKFIIEYIKNEELFI